MATQYKSEIGCFFFPTTPLLKGILYLLYSYLFCILLQKHKVYVTGKLLAICNIVLLINEILLMKTEIYIYILFNLCIYLSVKQMYHMTSTFSAGPFACQFLHDDTKKEHTQISWLFLKENKTTATLFQDQNCKRNYLNCLERDAFFSFSLCWNNNMHIFPFHLRCLSA